MTKRKPKTVRKTIVRKNTDNIDTMALVSDYADGQLTLEELAHKYNTSTDNVALIAKRFWKSLTNMRESRVLKSYPESNFDSRASLAELNNSQLINDEFLGLLSKPESKLLSDEEATYCWTYVHTGDIPGSLLASGLDIGLYREKKRGDRFSFDRAIVLRGHYLNTKPNIAEYIKELRETRLIDANVGKSRIQSELIDQLEQMKAAGDPRFRRDILRTIELLGKTVGAFTENIQISQVNPSNALDELIEMAKEAEITEATPVKLLEVNE